MQQRARDMLQVQRCVIVDLLAAQTDDTHRGCHGLSFGITPFISTARNIPPEINPSRSQSSARRQSS